MKKVLSFVLSMIMFCLLTCSVYASNEITGLALLESYGLSIKGYSGATSDLKAAYMDENGRLVVQSGTTGGNSFVSACLGNLKGTLEDWTIEAALVGVAVNDGWHYGIAYNNDKSNSATPSFSMRSGAYADGKTNGQMICTTKLKTLVPCTLGKTNTDFSTMSAAVGVENVFSITYDSQTKTLTHKINGSVVASVEDTQNEYTLSEFNVMIPKQQTVAIVYLRVYDGEGVLVYDEDFKNDSTVKHSVTVHYTYEDGTTAAESVIREVYENSFYSISSPEITGYQASVENVSGKMGTENVVTTVVYSPKTGLDAYGLEIHDYQNNSGVSEFYLDDAGRLVIKAGNGSGNIFVGKKFDDLDTPLKEYTVEMRLMGVAVNDGWHYGLAFNNDQTNAATPNFTMRSGAYSVDATNGQMLCNAKTSADSSSYLGMPNSKFAQMSSAVGVENTYSVTYDPETQSLTYRMNGVEVVTLKDSSNIFTLSELNVMIPRGQTVAICYMRVYDGDGNVVFNEDFKPQSSVSHQVTVNYTYENGETALPSVTQTVFENEYYLIPTKAISGYLPTLKNAAGQMKNSDVTVSVVFKKIYQVTVHYVLENGTKLYSSSVISDLVDGDNYHVTPILIVNYEADRAEVFGTVNGKNEEVTFVYTYKQRQLQIKYCYEDGTEAAAMYQSSVKHGAAYRVESPVIDGYIPDVSAVEGDALKKDLSVVVTYRATNGDSTTEPDTSAGSDTTADAEPSPTQETGCASLVGSSAVLLLLMGFAGVTLCKKSVK